LAGEHAPDDPAAERRLVWIGGLPVIESSGGKQRRVILPNQTTDVTVTLPQEKSAWLLELIQRATPVRAKKGEGYPSFQEVRAGYPFGGSKGFDGLLKTDRWRKVRAAGLLLV
jgi:hypothetical protein